MPNTKISFTMLHTMATRSSDETIKVTSNFVYFTSLFIIFRQKIINILFKGDQDEHSNWNLFTAWKPHSRLVWNCTFKIITTIRQPTHLRSLLIIISAFILTLIIKYIHKMKNDNSYGSTESSTFRTNT